MEGHFENEPLLYIEQPAFKKPQVQMQNEYYSIVQKDELEKQEQKKDGLEKNRKLSKKESFHTLTILEKIEYLLALPKDVMQVKCEVQTANDKLVGTILKRENDRIEMDDQLRKSHTIPLKDIENIRLIGL